MMADNDTRDAKLRLGVETKGTDEAAKSLQKIGKGATDLQKELGRISRTSQIDDLSKEMGAFARETGLTGKAVDDLNKKLKALGANEDEIKSAARGFESARTGGSSGGGGGGNAPAAAKFRGAASLVGGGELVGLIDDFQDLGEGLVELKSAAPGAAQGLMSLAASMGPAGLLAAGAAAVAVVALGAVLKTFADERAKEAEVVRNIIEANKSARTKAIDGATTADFEKDMKRMAELRQLEVDQIAENARLFEENFTDNGFVDGVKTLASTLDDELATSTANSEAAIKKYDIEMQAHQLVIDEGRTAINDTAADEKALAEVRQNETPKAIDTAVNAERDRAREMEKVAREQERAAAEAAREQERIAAEQQRRAEQAAAAQQKYADGIKNANTALKQSTQDINTKSKQGEFDLRTGMGRDLDDIQLKNTQEVTKLITEDWRSARDEALQNANEIDDIRREGYKAERDALQEGNFKEAFLSKRDAAERITEEQRTDQREEQLRKTHLTDMKDDLKLSLKQEQDARRTSGIRAFEDLKLNTTRELQQAQLTRTRALEMNSASYKAELAALGTFLQQRNNLLTQASQAALANIGGGRGGSGLNNTGRSIQQQMAAAVGGIIRR